MRYKPKRDIPLAVRELGNTQPTRIVEWILSKRNEERLPESITMWFKRHPTIKEDLELELKQIQLPDKEIKDVHFKSGTFENYESIVTWVKQMRRRGVKKITDNLSALKRGMQGVKPRKKIDLRFQGWVMKHPDRFILEDAEELVDLYILHYPDIDISTERNVMRNFLESKGIFVGKKISGKKHKSVGTLKRLFCPRDTIQLMFDYLQTTNYQAYVIDLFMFKTGTRITATLNATLEDITIEGEFKEIKILDKGDLTWYKQLSPELWDAIVLLTGYPDKRKSGKLFTMTDDEMSEINRKLYEKFYPELWIKHPEYKMMNHFWRHMFAQHMLRQTGWKYGVVAALGGWTIKSLEESYGAPPREIVREWGMTQIPEL